MDCFRDDTMLNQLTPDDRIEIFSQVLTGSSDITKELLDELLRDYSVGNLEVIEDLSGADKLPAKLDRFK
ncbi:MAG TPA: hypothetical protein DCX06_04955 [Opitutae bacterium]|nr:hypothetical protein [Opitutae bacterium]